MDVILVWIIFVGGIFDWLDVLGSLLDVVGLKVDLGGFGFVNNVEINVCFCFFDF